MKHAIVTRIFFARTITALMALSFQCFDGPACLAQKPPTRLKNLGPGSHIKTLEVGGKERTYILHVPASYNPESPSPLVVMLHGGGGTATGAMRQTGWAEKGERERFLTVFPNAIARNPAQPSSFAANPQLWNDGSGRFYSDQKVPDDVGFVNALLDDLLAGLAVDARQIFVTGFSNGASMSFRLGAELSRRIAAIAPVAGACWLEALALARPVSMLYITGTADPLNPIEGGVPRLATGASDRVRGKPKPAVRDSISKWAEAIGCPATPHATSDENGVRTEIYSAAEEGAEVVYIAVEGLGHTWAGGTRLLPEYMVGKTSDKIHATDVIWGFFQRHPLR